MHPRCVEVSLLVLVLILASGNGPSQASPISEPEASPGVQALLDRAAELDLQEDLEGALEVAGSAVDLAREKNDLAGEASALRRRAAILDNAGRITEAIEAWRETDAAWQRFGNVRGRVEALAAVSILMWEERPEDARRLVAEVLELADSEDGEPAGAISALAKAGSVAVSQDLYDAARALIEPALELAEIHAPGGLVEAVALAARGELASAEENLSEAAELRAREAEIRRKLQPASIDLADALVELAVAQGYLGNLEAAAAAHEEALAIRRERLPGSLAVADSLNGLGVVAMWGGDLDTARQRLTEALEIRETHEPGGASVAETLVNLGNISVMLADYREGRDNYEKAIEIFEEVCSECPGLGKALGNLRETLYRQGDLAAAEAQAKRSLPFFEEHFPDSIGLSFEYVGMGNIALYHDEIERAEDYFRRALDIRSRHVPGSHLHAECLHNLAHVALTRGRYDEARDHQVHALEIIEPFFGVTWATAHNLHVLGLIEWKRTDLEAAEEALRRSISIAEEALGTSHPQAGDALSTLAGVLATSGRVGEAMECALRAERIAREQLRLTTRTLPEREALLYDVLELAGRDLALSLAADTRGNAADAWDTLLRSRAVVLDEMAARHRTAHAVQDPAVASVTRKLAEARTRLAELVVAGPGEEPAEAYQAKLEEARSGKEQLETALAEHSTRFRIELRRSRAGLDDVAGALGERNALVAYARYGRLMLRTHSEGGPLPPEFEDSYIAFVLPPGGGEPIAVPLGATGPIEDLVTRLREHVAMATAAGDRSPKRTESTYRTIASDLRVAVWDPVASHLKGAETVFVVPDGALNFVSFAALPVGESRYLIEDRQVLHYLSAERDLLVPEAPAVSGVLLVLANPSFDDGSLFAALQSEARKEPEPAVVASLATYRGKRAACGDFDSVKFSSLPASAKESKEVATIWTGTGKRTASAGGGEGDGVSSNAVVVTLSGVEANESRFKARASGARVLHLATHGFFLTGACASSLEKARGRGPATCHDAVTGENPLLLAGLALAGANRRAAAGPGEEDGILTAEEIAALDLSGTEWAVLSACDTGLGRAKAGEGVLGLRRAFQVAGARTLIMSLWQVDDESTQRWMASLYRHRFGEGHSTAESVRAAGLELLEERRGQKRSTHPMHWAGFVAAGDWR